MSVVFIELCVCCKFDANTCTLYIKLHFTNIFKHKSLRCMQKKQIICAQTLRYRKLLDPTRYFIIFCRLTRFPGIVQSFPLSVRPKKPAVRNGAVRQETSNLAVTPGTTRLQRNILYQIGLDFVAVHLKNMHIVAYLLTY